MKEENKETYKEYADSRIRFVGPAGFKFSTGGGGCLLKRKVKLDERKYLQVLAVLYESTAVYWDSVKDGIISDPLPNGCGVLESTILRRGTIDWLPHGIEMFWMEKVIATGLIVYKWQIMFELNESPVLVDIFTSLNPADEEEKWRKVIQSIELAPLEDKH